VNLPLRISTATWLIVVLALTAIATTLQTSSKVDPKKFKHAVDRSDDASRIVAALALVPDTGLPRELIDKAEAVGVFPKVKKETVMFSSVSQGYGVISSRQGSGWSLPAYYQFSGGGYGSPFAGTETFGIVMLFMTTDAVSWFEKGGVPLKNDKKAIDGPVGPISVSLRAEIVEAQILE
jgi:lipid-binding SYLF domain-containing protein